MLDSREVDPFNRVVRVRTPTISEQQYGWQRGNNMFGTTHPHPLDSLEVAVDTLEHRVDEQRFLRLIVHEQICVSARRSVEELSHGDIVGGGHGGVVLWI
jgi:hypothetical protein